MTLLRKKRGPNIETSEREPVRSAVKMLMTLYRASKDGRVQEWPGIVVSQEKVMGRWSAPVMALDPSAGVSEKDREDAATLQRQWNQDTGKPYDEQS